MYSLSRNFVLLQTINEPIRYYLRSCSYCFQWLISFFKLNFNTLQLVSKQDTFIQYQVSYIFNIFESLFAIQSFPHYWLRKHVSVDWFVSNFLLLDRVFPAHFLVDSSVRSLFWNQTSLLIVRKWRTSTWTQCQAFLICLDHQRRFQCSYLNIMSSGPIKCNIISMKSMKIFGGVSKVEIIVLEGLNRSELLALLLMLLWKHIKK